MYIGISPMDGITTAAYRLIVENVFNKYGNKNDKLITVTEFMSADGFFRNPIGVAKHLLKINTGISTYYIAQIFGGNIDTLLFTAKWIYKNLDYDLIELNIGCPSPKICASGAGSAMLKDKIKTLDYIKILSEAVNGNFSIKTRVGLTQEDKKEQFDFLINASKYCKIITIHGRTFSQGHSGEVDWDFIYNLKNQLKDKIIIGNGGIKSYDQTIDFKNNLDGISIGQAGIGNPFVIVPIEKNLNKLKDIILNHFILEVKLFVYYNLLKQKLSDKSVDYQLNLLKEKLNVNISFIGKDLKEIISFIDKDLLSIPVKEFRKHLFAYLKGFPNGKKLKQEIIKILDPYEMINFINNL